MSKKQKPIVTTQQSQTTVDPMVSKMQKYTLDQTKSILSPYLNAKLGGYGVAGLNADQNAAFEGIRGQVGGITPIDVQGWMNPYRSAVIDNTTNRIQREGDEALNAIRGRTAAGSAFGGVGARGALAEAKTLEGVNRNIAETSARLEAEGFDKATATALANYQNQGAALQAMLGIGNQQQQLEQYKMDTPLRALTQLQGGTPQQYSSSTSGTTTQPAPQGPSALQTILGLGGSILGASTGGLAGPTIGGSIFNRLFPATA